MKSLFRVALISGAALAALTPALATHSWGGYHWAGNGSNLTLMVNKAITSQWTTSVGGAISDWNASNELTLNQQNAAVSAKRCSAIAGQILGQLDGRRLPADSPHFVADAIDDGLTKVRLHGAHVARLEHVEAPQHVHRRLLDEVLGIERPAGSRGQPAVRPALQRRKAALKQRFHGAAIARLRPDQELNGRLVAQEEAASGRVSARGALVGSLWARLGHWA